MSVQDLHIHTEQMTTKDHTHLYSSNTSLSLIHRVPIIIPLQVRHLYRYGFCVLWQQAQAIPRHAILVLWHVPVLSFIPCYIVILLSTNSDTKYVLRTTFSNWHLYVFKHLLSSTGDNAINNIERWARVDVLPDVSCRFFRSWSMSLPYSYALLLYSL